MKGFFWSLKSCSSKKKLKKSFFYPLPPPLQNHGRFHDFGSKSDVHVHILNLWYRYDQILGLPKNFAFVIKYWVAWKVLPFGYGAFVDPFLKNWQTKLIEGYFTHTRCPKLCQDIPSYSQTNRSYDPILTKLYWRVSGIKTKTKSSS